MSEGRVIFNGANLFDGEDVTHGSNVVVEGNRITQVTQGAVDAAEGDRTIDLAGKTLMPGMVQGHFHAGFGPTPNLGSPPRLGLEGPAAYMGMVAAKNAQIALQTGVTGTIGSSNGDFLDICLREAMIMGLVEGPRMLACTHEFMCSGDYADGTNRSWFMGVENPGLTRVVDGVDQIRAAAREELGRGCDVVKLSAAPGHGASGIRDFCFFTREEIEAVTQEAHDRGKLVRAHSPSRTSILRCAEAGVDIIDHGDRIDDAGIEAVLKQGASICPSMLWNVRFLQFAESWDYNMGPFPIGEGFPETREMTEKRLDEVRADFEYTCEILPKLAKSGINLVVGDDYGFAMMPHGDYVSEYEVYVKQVGIPALDVLRWATRNGAKLMAGPLGLDAGHGTIAVGQLADLLVVDGDPVADISCLRDRVVAIVRNGEFIRDGLAA